MKKLSRVEMKNVSGGGNVVYTCSCSGGVGTWSWPGGDMPNQSIIDHSIQANCSSGSGTCLWRVEGNPGI